MCAVSRPCDRSTARCYPFGGIAPTRTARCSTRRRMYGHKGRRAEWELRDRLEERGCYVVRSAASRNIDLLAIEPNGACVGYEVKSTSSHRLSLNTVYGREQFTDHCRLARRIPVYYAVRFTVGCSPVWKIFKVTPDLDLRLSTFREDGLPL